MDKSNAMILAYAFKLNQSIPSMKLMAVHLCFTLKTNLSLARYFPFNVNYPPPA